MRVFTLFAILLQTSLMAQTTFFQDDFDASQGASYTTTGAIGSSPWQVLRAGNDWGARIDNNILELTNDASSTGNAVGWIFASIDASTQFSVGYDPTLANNTVVLEWSFNLRQIRNNPSGFTGNRYGVAFVLGATNTAVEANGDGYAIVLGQTGGTDPIRLVRFTGGLGTIPNDGSGALITASAPLDNVGDEYISIRVTYNPATNTWTLYGRDDGTSSFSDPASGTLSLLGSATDNTHVNKELKYMGAFWRGSIVNNQTALFDNLTVKSKACVPINWVGTTSTAWNNASNWSTGQVPNALSAVTIPDVSAGSNQYPIITNNEVICELTIDANAELTISPQSSLIVGNNLNNNGHVLLQADATGYAQLKFRGDYSGLPTVKQEQYVTGNGWHNVATPFKNTQAGQFGTVGTDRAPLAENMFGWNANPSSANPYRWQLVPNNAATLIDGLGYNTYFGTNGVQANASQQYTLELEGEPIKTVSPPLFYAEKVATSSPVTFVVGNGDDGWNLLANPFTCALDFSTFDFDPATDFINNSFYIYNPATSSYAYYAGGGIGTPQIAPLQSFFIQTTSSSVAPTLPMSMKANSAVAAPAPTFYKTKSRVEKLVLDAFETAMPQNKDHTVLANVPQTTFGFDGKWDAHKMRNGADHPNMYTTHINGDAMAVNAIDINPTDSSSHIVSLAFEGKKQGQQYTLQIRQNLDLPGYNIQLEDKKINSFHDLKTGSYTFTYDSALVNRFALHITSAVIGIPKYSLPNAPAVWFAGNELRLTAAADFENAHVAVYNTSGQLVANSISGNGIWVEKAGVYIVHVTTNKGHTYHVKVMKL